MTPTETLARLADAATPGPWIKSTRGCDAMISTEALGFLFPALGNSEGAHQDAEFIAAANPSAIKSLLARIERLEIAAKSLAGTILAHDIESLSCDRDGETYCDCVRKEAEKINAILGGENAVITDGSERSGETFGG